MKFNNPEFIKELTSIINKYSIDSELSRPDFLLAQLLVDHLSSLHSLEKQYDKWKGTEEVAQTEPTIVINPGNLQCGLPSANVVIYENFGVKAQPPVNQDKFNEEDILIKRTKERIRELDKKNAQKSWSGNEHFDKLIQQKQAEENTIRAQQAAQLQQSILGYTSQQLLDLLYMRKK